MQWRFDNTYARELSGLYSPWRPEPVAAASLVALNDDLATELGLDAEWLRSEQGVAVLAGNAVPEGATPLAQAYAGHQFGHFSGLLGDGRALVLGEVVDVHGRRRDVALKGSGRTPYSRGGDGRAAIGPVLREYLVGEAMHALGIPTTRALAAVATGEVVRRELPQPGAVLTRVASSHLRVGTFELVARQGSVDQLRRLADYARDRHYPQLESPDPLDLLAAVAERQAELVAAWLSVGFVHGVMNTDNMTISGETIDYGPCAFLDGFDVRTVFSSIDTGGRYAFGAQPTVAAWNLARLAEALLPLAEGEQEEELVERANQLIHGFLERLESARLRRFRRKLGLADDQADDASLVDDLLALMQSERWDMTLTFRRLAQVVRGDGDAVRGHALDLPAYDAWQDRWLTRLGDHDPAAVARGMDETNPLYLPRNHLVEEALAAGVAGDLGPFRSLLTAVREPFVERAGLERYAEPAPDGFTESYVTFCGT